MFNAINSKLNYLLWEIKLRDVTAAQAFAIRMVRIFYGAIRDLRGGLPTLRAMSLVYTTLLSLVPLLAVSVSVLKGFGVHNQLEPFLLNMLEQLGDKRFEITSQILGFVDNMKLGALGSIGLMFLFVTVVSLVMKIESAFNYTWRIQKSRPMIQRFSNYLSVILLGPVLLFIATSIATTMSSHTVTEKLLTIEPFGSMIVLLGKSIPLVLTVFSFTLIYALIPNTKVRFASAFYGAVVATISSKAVGSLFTMFMVNSTNYTAIYSGFAILIIFMIWIYTSWLIILAGASVAYYHQNPEQISDSSQVIRLSCRLREKLALSIMQMIAERFHHDQPAMTMKELTRRTQISEMALSLVLNSLIKHRIVTVAGKKANFYLPARSLETIQLSDILVAARQAEEVANLHPDDIGSEARVNDTFEHIENAISDSVKTRNLKDLVSDHDQNKAAPIA